MYACIFYDLTDRLMNIQTFSTTLVYTNKCFIFIRCKTSRYVKSLNQPLRILPSVNKPAPPKLQTTSLFWLYGCAETTLHCPLYIRHLTLLNLQTELSLWKLRNHYIGIFQIKCHFITVTVNLVSNGLLY